MRPIDPTYDVPKLRRAIVEVNERLRDLKRVVRTPIPREAEPMERLKSVAACRTAASTVRTLKREATAMMTLQAHRRGKIHAKTLPTEVRDAIIASTAAKFLRSRSSAVEHDA